jgi:hypothetical protein
VPGQEKSPKLGGAHESRADIKFVKVRTHDIWSTISSLDILLLGFSDEFARRSTLIMSFPSPLIMLSFIKPCAKLRT